jgi:hypothetical protein
MILGIGWPADKRASHALPRRNMGAAREAELNPNKIGNARQQADNGIAVLNAQCLGHCWLELKQALARLGTRPQNLPIGNLASYGAMHCNLDSPEGQAWVANCLIDELASLQLRQSVADGALQIWRIHEAREVPVAPVVLDNGNVRYGVFKTREHPVPEWDGAKLWVKRADWDAFMAANFVPDPAVSRAPSTTSFVPLSDALSWIAFGIAMNPELMFHLLSLDSYAGKIPQEAIRQAVTSLLAIAGDGRIALRGKYRENREVDDRYLDTLDIQPIKLADFRRYQHLYDALCYGDGPSSWRHETGINELFASGRRDAFVGVTVNRAELLREFPITAGVAIGTVADATVGAETECRAWLENAFNADHDRRLTKPDFQREAVAHFGGRPSVRDFLRAWDDVAPKANRTQPSRNRNTVSIRQ